MQSTLAAVSGISYQMFVEDKEWLIKIEWEQIW